MADKSKRGKGGGGSGGAAKKSLTEKVTADKPAKKEQVVEAQPALSAHKEAHDEHKHAASGGHGAAHGHKVDRREYWKIFVVLLVLTILEVGVAQVPGIAHGLMVVALIGMALSKAACVGLFYMHLKHETKILKLTVALPFAAPAVYALVLISDAAWRLVRW
jgi:cytochrome c oxidase subunit 4